MKVKLNERMKEISEFFKDLPQTHFVGGCIRDYFMKKEPHDYDMCTVAEPEEVMAYIKSMKKKVYKTGLKHGTVSVRVPSNLKEYFGPNTLVEITTFRSDTYEKGNRKPQVEYTDSLDRDLSRRDFTINALACDLSGKLKGNYQQALDDIKNKVLRTVGNSKTTFRQDPLRIERGIRIMAENELIPEEMTARRINHCRWDLFNISKERIIDEINKMMLLPPKQALAAMKLLYIFEIWQIVEPHMQSHYEYDQYNPNHDFDLHIHDCKTFYNVRCKTNNLKLLWAALLHDIGKVPCAEEHKDGTRNNYINHEILGADLANDFLIKYKFSNKDRNFIVKTIRDHVLDTCWLKKFDNMSKKRK